MPTKVGTYLVIKLIHAPRNVSHAIRAISTTTSPTNSLRMKGGTPFIRKLFVGLVVVQIARMAWDTLRGA